MNVFSTHHNDIQTILDAREGEAVEEFCVLHKIYLQFKASI